jgi:hypothetical protein
MKLSGELQLEGELKHDRLTKMETLQLEDNWYCQACNLE